MERFIEKLDRDRRLSRRFNLRTALRVRVRRSDAAERSEGRIGHRSAAVRLHSLTFSSLRMSSVDTSNRRNRS